MPEPVVVTITNADVRFGAVPVPPLPIDGTALTDYACQVTRCEITATSNTRSTTRIATFCAVEAESSVPVASSFTLNLDWFQDWAAAAASGLSQFMFKHDATKQAFAIYQEGALDPEATGVVTVVAGGFGGVPGEPLTASVQMQIDGYPRITDGAGAPIRPDPVVMTTTADEEEADAELVEPEPADATS